MSLAISAMDPAGYGMGVELNRKNGEKYEVYYIASLYFTRSEFPSVRSLRPHVFSLILPKVNEQDELLIIKSNSPYFRDKVHEVRRNATLFAGQKNITVRFERPLYGYAVTLSQDAAKRKTNITEKF